MDKKILYCLLHGESCMDRVENVFKTWGQNVDIIFYSDYDNLEKKVYKVTDKKGYLDLEEKHINGLKFINSNFVDYKWYFFCDDDTFVNTKKMNEFLEIAQEDIVYGYLINCWRTIPSLYFPSGGAGVLISKKNLKKVSNNIVGKGTKFAADVTLGLNLIDENIKVSNCEYFHSEKSEHYGISVENIKEHITFHHIKNLNEMQTYYNLCKN
jgi:hypothetical protein